MTKPNVPEIHGCSGTPLRDAVRHCETLRDTARLYEILRDSTRPCETLRDPARLYETL